MKPRELFQTCRKELLEIIVMTEQRDKITATLLPRAIQLTADRIKVHPENYFAEAMAQAADLDADIAEKLKPMLARQQEAMLLLNTVRESKHRNILRLYYLTMKEEMRGSHHVMRLHTWDDVAEALYYESSYARKLCGDAFAELEQ